MKKIITKKRVLIFSLVTVLIISLFSAYLIFGKGWFNPAQDKFSSAQGQTASPGAQEKPAASSTQGQPVCSIIPKPAELSLKQGNFTLGDTASIYVKGNSDTETDEIYKVAQYLASKLKTSTGFAINIAKSDTPPDGSIYLTTVAGDSSLGNEGYRLDVTANSVSLSAFKPEGLFRGIQTIRQMLPADIEKSAVAAGVPWTIPCSSVTDYPAYPWRGMMLDVARHFIKVEDVKRTIDLMAQYKMNKFHMHLSDDQGWRIEIKSWPDLTKIGGSTQVGGGNGGFYTQEEYSDIVKYAQERYITVIPEIDMPGHSNAALASYGELNPDGKKKEPYTGIEVGFSSLMCRSEVTYKFIDDVIGELAAITPGEYIHVGGDEAKSTSKEDYDYFVGRVNQIVSGHGKNAIGWGPFDTPDGTPSAAMLQKWDPDSASAERKGMKIVLSPAEKAYMDMKYDDNSPIGLKWAGLIPTNVAYNWDPTDYAPQKNIAGIECTLWTETVQTMDDIEYLAFPRLLGHAEVGWTARKLRNWDEYKLRLKDQGPRMANEGIGFYKDPTVPW